jgi:hypothetical protein
MSHIDARSTLKQMAPDTGKYVPQRPKREWNRVGEGQISIFQYVKGGRATPAVLDESGAVFISRQGSRHPPDSKTH